MLAQISALSGVANVRADATGRTFVLSPSSSADTEFLAAETVRILGPESYRLEGDWAAIEAADAANEGLWLDPGNIRLLSLLEARILSAKWGSAAAHRAALGRVAADRLILALRCELAAAFERIHSAGGTADRGWFKKDLAEALPRAIARLGAELDAARADAALASLRESLGA